MTTCAPTVTEIGWDDRVHITWDTTGVDPDADQAYVRVEGGPRLPLNIGTNVVVGFFAGPAYPSPAPAIVVTHTVWTDIVIVTATETITFPGGFIRLRP